MPRGRKPNALKQKIQQQEEPVKAIEQVDLSNKEDFINLLEKRGVSASSLDGIVYAVVKPDEINDVVKIMEECKTKVDYKGSYGAGVGNKK